MKKKKIIRWSIIGAVVLIVLLIVLKKSGVIGSKQTIKITTELSTRRTITETVTANGKIQPEKFQLTITI